MSKTDTFWQYAKEAILSAYEAKSDEDKEGLLELARTWTQAPLLERASANHHDGLAEAGAALPLGEQLSSRQSNKKYNPLDPKGLRMSIIWSFVEQIGSELRFGRGDGNQSHDLRYIYDCQQKRVPDGKSDRRQS
jgi:hypothetical protein